ncbi:methyltransferase family protein [Pseudemcibacter aquimaris]|uniref:methyltransferase family protein n=1 Tax=Pseudemcibacter aquimaris TaxID=2857064 RepID=UPI002011DADC|nr:isoprenylcysteine carboxylmethyltransferase family protein [Pseudemcibacter aquimaris]MCC3861751.1 DUF1295 domain-containing protein [Pseudemcibacter aquimaris]WDU58520.1 DUF1295 domain-containing protein [Pseudemcibacter aquimaris]
MTKISERPVSDIKGSTGWIGVVALSFSLALCFFLQLQPFQSIFLCLLITLVSMVSWDVLVNKVYLNDEFDFSKPLPRSETFAIVKTKYVGFLVLVVAIMVVYSSFNYYTDEHFDAYKSVLQAFLPIILTIAPVYFWLTTKYMTNPKDSLWQFGKLVTFQIHLVEADKIKGFCMSWTIKVFFFAFMASFMPPQILYFTNHFELDLSSISITEAFMLINRYILIFDMALGTVGYIMTFKILNSHIRSSNPYLMGWVAALICYPPFSIIGKDEFIYYQKDTLQWHEWFAGNDTALIIWAAIILIFTAIYSWATIVFGIRFSNLTNRGIITDGPFKYTKHPAYISKNVFWWLTFLPFLTTSNTAVAMQNCLMLIIVNLIYYWRAKTEEKHLMEEPKYREYVAYMEEHSLIAKLKRKFR